MILYVRIKYILQSALNFESVKKLVEASTAKWAMRASDEKSTRTQLTNNQKWHADILKLYDLNLYRYIL